jgi:hypothetical protein
VLQEALNEVYVTYLLSVYLDEEYFQDKTIKEWLSQHHGANCIAEYKYSEVGYVADRKTILELTNSSPRLTHPTIYKIFLSP